jgi:hypothetical protein
MVDREGIGGNTLPKDAKITDMLSSWRTLHVEPDSMDDPPIGEVFDEAGPWPGSAPPRPDPNVIWDWEAGDLGDDGNVQEFFREPSLDWLTDQLARAYIEVKDDLQAYDVQDQAVFRRNLTAFVDESRDYTNTVRDVESIHDFWTIQVFAAYDNTLNGDLDGTGQTVYLGWTRDADPGDGPLRVPTVLNLETLRDRLTNSGEPSVPSPAIVVQRGVVHEVLHRFNVGHDGLGPMVVDHVLFGDDDDNRIAPAHIHAVRTWRRP